MAVKRALQRWLVTGLVLAAVASTVGADPKESYKSAIEAIEAGRWAEAEQQLRSAIAERADSGRFGLLGLRYMPYYYLGVALAEQGDCEEALEAFATADRQGQVQKLNELYIDLKERQATCSDLLAKTAAARRRAEGVVARAEGAASTLARLSRDPLLAPVWAEGRGSFAARQQDADRSLEQARQLLGPEATEVELNKAAELATASARAYDEMVADAEARLAVVRDEADSALERLQKVEASLERMLSSISDLIPYPPLLEQRVVEAKEALDAAGVGKAGARPAELVELSQRLTVAMSSLRRAAQRPPGVLARAVEAFLNGEYQSVIDQLTDHTFDDPRILAHICLLRAASHHALYVLAGGVRQELLDEATSDVAACAGLEEPLQPPASVYPPHFRDFYQTTMQALAAEEDAESGDEPAVEPSPGA